MISNPSASYAITESNRNSTPCEYDEGHKASDNIRSKAGIRPSGNQSPHTSRGQSRISLVETLSTTVLDPVMSQTASKALIVTRNVEG